MSWMSPDEKKTPERVNDYGRYDGWYIYIDYIRLQDAVIEGSVEKMQSIMDKDI